MPSHCRSPIRIPDFERDMAMADWIDQRYRLLVLEAEQHTDAILVWATAARNAPQWAIALTATLRAVYHLDVTTPAWGQEQAALAHAGAQVREALLPLAEAWAREQAINECRGRFAA